MWSADKSIWSVCKTALRKLNFRGHIVLKLIFANGAMKYIAYRASFFTFTGTQRFDVFPFNLPRVHQKLILKLLSPTQRQSQQLTMQMSQRESCCYAHRQKYTVGQKEVTLWHHCGVFVKHVINRFRRFQRCCVWLLACLQQIFEVINSFAIHAFCAPGPFSEKSISNLRTINTKSNRKKGWLGWVWLCDELGLTRSKKVDPWTSVPQSWLLIALQPVPRWKSQTLVSFRHASPHLWNKLPVSLRQPCLNQSSSPSSSSLSRIISTAIIDHAFTFSF